MKKHIATEQSQQSQTSDKLQKKNAEGNAAVFDQVAGTALAQGEASGDIFDYYKKLDEDVDALEPRKSKKPVIEKGDDAPAYLNSDNDHFQKNLIKSVNEGAVKVVDGDAHGVEEHITFSEFVNLPRTVDPFSDMGSLMRYSSIVNSSLSMFTQNAMRVDAGLASQKIYNPVVNRGVKQQIAAQNEREDAPYTNPYNDVEAPNVKVYSLNLDNPSPGDYTTFGRLAVQNGDDLIVQYSSYKGAAGTLTSSGQVLIYDATTGALKLTIDNPSPANYSLFGAELTIYNDTIYVSSPGGGAPSRTGVVYQYDYNTGTLLDTINNPTPATNEYFGSSIQVMGDKLIIGAYGDKNGSPTKSYSGAVYVYDVDDNSLLYSIANPTPAASDYFGAIVVASDEYLFISADSDDTTGTDSGSVYIYDIDTGAYVATIANPTPGIEDYFGYVVKLFGDKLVISAPYDDNGLDEHGAPATDNGAIHVYDASDGSFLYTAADPTPHTGEEMGWYLTYYNEYLIVGNPGDANGDDGVGGVYEWSGSVNIYDINDGTLITTILNPDAADSAQFGYPTVSGDVLIVGAPGTANGDDGAGGSYADSGSVYLYDLTTFDLIARVDNPVPTAGDLFGFESYVYGDTMMTSARGADVGAYNNAGAIYSVMYDFDGDGYVVGSEGDDILYSSSGIDYLFGNGGADRFVLQSYTVFDALDVIMDFDAAEGDAIDISQILSGYDPMTDALSDFVKITNSGANSQLWIDVDGAGTGAGFEAAVMIFNQAGLNVDTMVTNSALIV